MAFPIDRPRRLRRGAAMRDLVRETHLQPANFILPLFVVEGEGIRKEIKSMPGNAQLSIDKLIEEAREAKSLGVGGVILFGIPKHKDEDATGAYDDEGIVQKAVAALKQEVPGLLVVTDVCNCEYTSHGHCGKIIDDDVDNDITLNWLAQAAVSHARAGADIVAPSDMMDGRVGAIRAALDDAGFSHSYQMDPANAREAIKEMALDIEEGADMLMVKPAGPYLDIIKAAYDNFDVPIAAYQVSGEFSMIHAAARNGWIDLERAMMESLISIKRAGAQIILTYFAKDASRLL